MSSALPTVRCRSSPIAILQAILKRFLTFDARNVSTEIYLVLIGAYLGMLVFTISSIHGRFSSPAAARTWMIAVVFLPIVGMAAYCISCLRAADYSFLKSLGILRKSKIDTA